MSGMSGEICLEEQGKIAIQLFFSLPRESSIKQKIKPIICNCSLLGLLFIKGRLPFFDSKYQFLLENVNSLITRTDLSLEIVEFLYSAKKMLEEIKYHQYLSITTYMHL